MKTYKVIRGVILISLGLLCKNNVWYFDPGFEMVLIVRIFISGTLLVFLKEDGKWVWKNKRIDLTLGCGIMK